MWYNILASNRSCNAIWTLPEEGWNWAVGAAFDGGPTAWRETVDGRTAWPTATVFGCRRASAGGGVRKRGVRVLESFWPFYPRLKMIFSGNLMVFSSFPFKVDQRSSWSVRFNFVFKKSDSLFLKTNNDFLLSCMIHLSPLYLLFKVMALIILISQILAQCTDILEIINDNKINRKRMKNMRVVVA